MKKRNLIILFCFICLITSGCTVKRLNSSSIDQNIDTIMNEKSNLYNVYFDGYKYYVPKGLKFLNKDDYNALFADAYENHYYLYVDVISYYHKTELDYSKNSQAYYSRKLKYGKKTGYLEINKVEDKYFIECMYNYAKIEVYVDDGHLMDAIDFTFTILKSIKYNDKVLNSLVGENILNYKEESFNIFESKAKKDDFLDYVKEYDKYKDTKDELPDEDKIDID